MVVRRKNTMNNVLDTMSMIPYLIPGPLSVSLALTFSKGWLVLTTMAIMIMPWSSEGFLTTSSVAGPADTHHNGEASISPASKLKTS